MAEQYSKEQLMEQFLQIFGEGETPRVFFAPGRVNLIGEHTDYNGGHVFPCALTFGIYAAARLRKDNKLRFYSGNVARLGVLESSLDALEKTDNDSWTSYAKGVLWAIGERGITLPCGMELLIWGNIPNGAGLSSSAALEVVVGLAARELYGLSQLTMQDLALIGQKAENDFCGLSCGIMDQFASAMGKQDAAIFLDTNTLIYEYAPVKLPNAKVVITNSNVKHSLVGSAYNDRRRECEEALADIRDAMEKAGTAPDALPKSLGALSEEDFENWKHVIRNDICRARAKHAVYENQRTIRAVAALKKDDAAAFGALMNASHDSLRDDYEVSCPEVDTLVELARSVPGVIGSRITGGGFGGCTVSLVACDAIPAFEKTVGEGYQKATGLTADFYVVDMGQGAHEI